MLDKIRSSVILKKIFLYQDYKRKLRLIIYNKNIQKKLNVNIIDYKRLSGKYKDEKNDKIYEYNIYDDKLLFEGECLNGTKNGRGKEYNEDGKLIFKGEYLNGKKYKGIENEYNEDNGKLS